MEEYDKKIVKILNELLVVIDSIKEYEERNSSLQTTIHMLLDKTELNNIERMGLLETIKLDINENFQKKRRENYGSNM